LHVEELLENSTCKIPIYQGNFS